MKIKITSDSTCDLTGDLLAKYDISLTRLSVIKDGVEYQDGGSITPADIFAHVAAGGDLCSTTAFNASGYEEIFAKYSEEYDGIIHISLGSGFSCSYQNACLAAEDFPKVRVIDSMNLSTGQGHVVMEACRLRDTDMTLDEMADALRAFAPRVEASFLLDQLRYMVKGGRCSAVAALGANLLGLKPCIEVRDGKMSVVKKYRGNYSKCLANYVKDRLADREDILRNELFLTYTPVTDENLAAVKEAIAQYGNFDTVYETTAGCTVSCHCGPGTLGVLFVRK